MYTPKDWVFQKIGQANNVVLRSLKLTGGHPVPFQKELNSWLIEKKPQTSAYINIRWKRKGK